MAVLAWRHTAQPGRILEMPRPAPRVGFRMWLFWVAVVAFVAGWNALAVWKLLEVVGAVEKVLRGMVS